MKRRLGNRRLPNCVVTDNDGNVGYTAHRWVPTWPAIFDNVSNRLIDSNHRLRGSVSTVVTMTSKVNGITERKFRPPVD